jgi:hypothetical protein
MRCGDGGLRSSRKAGRIGRGHRLPPQLGHIPIKWPSTQRRQKVHSYVQIIASGEAGGRSTSQHSQLGRSSSTPQVYLMMTVGTHQPPCHHSYVPRRSHGRALSAGAADVRQPMRGLDLLLRRDASPRSRTALIFCRGSAPAMFGKRWRVDSFARFTGGMDVFQACATPYVCVTTWVPAGRGIAWFRRSRP